LIHIDLAERVAGKVAGAAPAVQGFEMQYITRLFQFGAAHFVNSFTPWESLGMQALEILLNGM
jgi:hypothetical protein